MNILAVDTSSKASSCAVAENGNLLGEFFINASLTHSQTILPMIDALLKATRQSLDHISLIAVTDGPGSFTGLRIGLATVKGLAYSRDIPCVSVSTLEALAYNLVSAKALIVPVMDARRNQMYTGVYLSDGENIETIVEPTTFMVEQLRAYLLRRSHEETVFLVGDGAETCYNTLKGTLPQLRLAPMNLRHQRASSILLAVYKKNYIHKAINEKELIPEYLRIPQAERELKGKNL